MQTKARVLFLSNEAGGSATYQAQQIEFLVARGVEVALCDEHPEHTLARLPRATAELVTVIQAPLWSDSAKTSTILARWWPDRRGFVTTSNPGILVKYAAAFRAARRQHAFRLVCTLHSGMLVMTPRRFILEWVASFLYRNVDCVSFVSEFTQAYWCRRYPWMRTVKSQVVHNGVRLPDGVVPRPQVTPMRVGFVGRLSPEKDADLFCRVAEQVSRSNLPMAFHVWGDGPLAQSLQTRYGASPLVWRGNTSDIAKIYADIDILLMTSPVENCPFALLEAKSYGVPVVSAAVGGIPEIVEPGVDSILTKSRHVSALHEGLQKAIDDYIRLSKGCLATRCRYEIDALCQETWQGFGLILEPAHDRDDLTS